MKIRLGVEGRQLVFELSRDGTDAWRVAHDGRQLGLAYKLRDGGWKARPHGTPAPAVTYETRAQAVVALYVGAP